MGFDIKAALDGIVAFATQYYPFILAGFAILLLFGKNNPIRHGIQKALTDNWQLTLLASTGIALSLASGYTTFDGLRNFTSAPLLSVFISFGIQGVMLIVAWLIGESFAVGMNQRNSEGRRVRLVDASVGMLLGVAFIGLVFYWTLQQANAVSLTSSGSIKADMGRFADVAMYFLLALVLVAMLAFGFRRGGDISTPYVQSLRLIVKNAVLWVMFLASMAASVFFSFDSHFNAIFPSEARKRAAEIRTTNQIGGVISDIGALTQKRQIEEAERLFDTEGWKAYDKQLTSLGQTAQGAQGEIEKYFVQRMEERRRAIAQQQERVATAQSGQAGLAGKKVSLAEELSRLKVERPTLAAEYGQHQSELDAKAREIDAKRVEGLAEDRGVEGTLKQGKGPVYRQRQAELATLQDQYKIKQERTNDAKKRLTAVETRIAHIERELSTIDGDLAKLKGEASTAEQRIKAAEAVSADDDAGKVDPARVLPAFERARAAFRQQPDTERLGALQLQCTQLATAMLNAPAVRESARGIDCDPKQAAEAAARVFALNAGIAAFQTNCAGGDKIAKLSTTDGLLAFGRKCLQDSGLISKDSADVGARLSGIDMNRDDKAHRFVVTWNAFLDGNRLAYLSLVLAIGVDALVFMSGLFGAQALRSPLSDVPSPKARSAHQLEAIIEAALLPDTFKNARTTLSAMHPRQPIDGFTNEVRLYELDPESASQVRDVLNAGATIGAVRETDAHGHYLVRAELHTFLSDIIKRELKRKPEETERGLGLDRLEKRIREALMPYVLDTSDAVLQHLHPIDEIRGFTSEIFLNEVDQQHLRPVRNLLTAGSSLRVVARDKNDSSRYYVHADLYATLARIRARELAMEGRGRRPIEGGPLRQAAVADARSGQLQLPNARPAIRPPAPTEDELRVKFQDTMIEALGLTLGALHKVAEPAIAGQAVSAALALKRQAPMHHGLNEQLKLVESENNRALEQAQRALAAHFADDPRALELLVETETELRKLLPALVLLPEGGLFDRLVSALEEAQVDAPLSGDEDVLLKRLRQLKDNLDSMNWSEEAAWARVHRQIGHLNDISLQNISAGDGTGPTKH
ncbi:MAG: hypothetical protein ACAH24_00060 [Hyphomicrobiaceae bacterium]|jgi:hypothetical protein